MHQRVACARHQIAHQWRLGVLSNGDVAKAMAAHNQAQPIIGIWPPYIKEIYRRNRAS
jgi:hypothetical protein